MDLRQFHRKYSLRVGDSIKYTDKQNLLCKDRVVMGTVVRIEYNNVEDEWDVTTSPPYFGISAFWNPMFEVVESMFFNLDAPPAGKRVNMNKVNMIPGELEDYEGTRVDNEAATAVPGGEEMVALAVAVSSATKLAKQKAMESNVRARDICSAESSSDDEFGSSVRGGTSSGRRPITRQQSKGAKGG